MNDGQRVLLVDDEEDFCDVLAERLRARGLEVDVAPSGEAALEAVNRRSFDAVVLDMTMPGMDGIETLTRIRRIDPDVQAVMLSGRGTLSGAVAAMKLGAVDFLEKPADIDVLVSKITEASARKAAARKVRMDQELSDILKKKGW